MCARKRTELALIRQVLFLVFNLVCAFAPNAGAFLAFRFLAVRPTRVTLA